MSTKFQALTPMLICSYVEASIKFYIVVLGFELVNKMDDVGKSGWAALRCGAIDLMLASPTFLPEAVKVEGKYPQSIYYFYPEDIDSLYQHVKSKVDNVSKMRVTFYDMREFEITDPDGHILWFGQEISK